jgi:hypothetical protein
VSGFLVVNDFHYPIELSCCIIIQVENPDDSDDVVDYFYVDVDIDQNVTLSK